jgi:pimeloyl-ACP methyl ester carboxylesterase
MNGQLWPDGDDLYHSWIKVPTLLVYGKEDGLIDFEEEEEMMKVGKHYYDICALYSQGLSRCLGMVPF